MSPLTFFLSSRLMLNLPGTKKKLIRRKLLRVSSQSKFDLIYKLCCIYGYVELHA